jgi:zinc protease
VSTTDTLPGRLLVEESHDLPLVHFQVVLPRGSLSDPQGREGLTRLAARMLRRGTRRRATREIEDTIDGLGAELGIDTAPSYVRISGSVIRKSLEPMLSLLGEILREPSFPAAELELLKRETQAALVELCDNDAGLCSTHFRRALFRGHPYARPTIGRRPSLEPIDLDQVIAHYRRTLATASRLVAFSGDIRPDEAERLVREHLAEPVGADPSRSPVPEPVQRQGRHLTIVDKPERTQTQIQIGRLGTHARDADHTALLVGNAVFGGTFSSRLMKAVRSERGWSYGASSRLAIDRVREGFMMWTFPAATDAAACIALELELMEKWIDAGIDDDELAFAKSCMTKSYAFAIDTAEKRLEQAVELSLLDLPPDYFSGYIERIAHVTRAEVNESLRARLSPRDLVLTVLATERDLGDALRALPGLGSVEVVPFDADT